MILKTIIRSRKEGKKLFAVLVDPDKSGINKRGPVNVAKMSEVAKVDFIFVGGSIISTNINDTIQTIKKNTSIPVILFPGSLLQLSDKADGIFLLSLISGRNPEFLIGNHIVAAPFLKKSSLEIISTGYMLIEGGNTTSVEYMSNTKPIPAGKIDIAVATAIASEMLGHKMIYLEAGSGAMQAVPEKMIMEIKKNINIPIIVGGGLRSKSEIISACNAGADVIVSGTAIENDLGLLEEFSGIVHNL
jgi:putative glycerol-1-phosphate prenyltransferase